MEKYGTIPPRFTKEWWIHYWTYYKLHILLGAFLFFALAHLVYTQNTAVNYDLRIQYLTSNPVIPSESLVKLEKITDKLSEDVTGNNKVQTDITFDYMPSFEDFSQAQQLQSVQTRLIAEIKIAEKQLFIVDETVADMLYSYQSFLPVKSWAGEDVPDDMIYNEIAFSLSETDKLNELGFDTTHLYLCVLQPNAECLKKEECVKKAENAVIVAKELIKE